MFHCSVIKVPVILATAILDYHNQEGLSRTFFVFLKLFFSSCFRLFLSFSTANLDYHILLGLSRTFFQSFSIYFSVLFDSFDRISYILYFVNNFFHFLKIYCCYPMLSSQKFKLSFLSQQQLV